MDTTGILIVISAILFWIWFFSHLSKTNQTPKLPQKVDLTCPFCGCSNAKWYNPSQNEPIPNLFKCGDCMRYYGDTTKMTSEERLKVQKSTTDCQLMDQMPELDYVIDQVVSFFKHSNRRDYFPMVKISNGTVTAPYNSVSGNKTSNLHIASYLYISDIADQHLTMLCYQRLKKEMPYYTFALGNWFVTID